MDGEGSGLPKFLRRLRVAVAVWCILIALATILVPFTFQR